MVQINLDSHLLNYIIERDIEPGELLPPIKELATDEHLGISSSKVREQLEVARAMSLVDVRTNVGIRLRAFDFAPVVRLGVLYALARDIASFEHFGTLRIHIEVAFWDEACSVLLPEDLLTMREAITQARAKLKSHPIQLPHREHRTFHLTMFQRLDNPFVTGILEAYWDAYDAVAISHYADYSYWQQVWDYHERILNCIEAQDYAQAKQNFIEHTSLLRYPQPNHAEQDAQA